MALQAPICVTGGSGFLGSWCVKLLLERGYHVHTTTRSKERAAFLLDLPGARERLTIFDNVDLLKPGAYDEALRGCEAVLHTASPFFFQGGTEASLVTPAVEGTRNVLTSCRLLGVKKVALTSSTAAVYVRYGADPIEYEFTDQDWSDEPMMRAKENWYCLSKTLAEKLAWEMSREEGCPYQLAVINPTLILGPMLPGQPHLNTSGAALVGYMDGSKKEIENACKTLVDVRDVAEAHINAIERGTGWGRRFLLIGASTPFTKVATYIRDALPDQMKSNVPTLLSDLIGPPVMAAPPPNTVIYSAAPSEELLGVKYRSVEEMTRTCVQSMLANGFTASDQYKPGQ